MESRAKLLGHPIHPMLIVFPLGLLSTAVVFDILYVVTNNAEFATFAFWALVAGVLGGFAAAVFGFLDWTAIPANTRAKRVGLVHGVGNVAVTGLFLVSLILRMNDQSYLPSILPVVFGVLGASLAMVTAWLGGELVYRLRVGVDDGAGLDAPSSLNQPAGEVRRST